MIGLGHVAVLSGWSLEQRVDVEAVLAAVPLAVNEFVVQDAVIGVADEQFGRIRAAQR
jgi:hypothetical protein